MKGSGSGEFSGKARNTSESGKPTALAVLSQSETSLFNQTTQPTTGIFGSTAVAPVFGVSFQTPTAHPKFEGFSTDGTCSSFGTPTKTSTSNGGLFGRRNASMGEITGGGCFDSSNSKTSFPQSKPVETPLAQSTSNIFAAPQTSTAGNAIFGTSTTDGTCLSFGTPTKTSRSNEGLFGQQNASIGEKKGGGCFDSSNSKTSFQQSKLVETPLAQSPSNIFAAPQTSTASTGIFDTSTTVLGQTKTSLCNQTTQPIWGIFGSIAVAPVFGTSCQTTNVHPKFKGFSADGTCSSFGTPTVTSTSNGGLFGRQNASMGEKKGGGCLYSSNSKTSFPQSKPVETPLAQSTSNIFAAPQTSTASTGIFDTSTTVLGQTKTSLCNQTTQPTTGIFGSTNFAPVFGTSCQTTNAHPIFEGFNADGTCSLIGTPTSSSHEGLFDQQNASMGKKTGGGCFDFRNSKTSFRQSKPVETPLAQSTSNIFTAPRTSTASTGIFGTSTTVLGQTKTSLCNQTTQPIWGIFGSIAVAPVFGTSCQTTNVHPKFKGFSADGTCSSFGTPTVTSTSNGGLFGRQNASMGEKKGGGCLYSSNSKTSFPQSKPVETPLAQPTSNIFAAPQTSTAGNAIFDTSTTGFNADGTSSLHGTPTATSTSNGGLFGQENASMGGKAGGVCLGSSNSNTSFRQSKPSGTPLAQSTNNIFAAPQTSTAGAEIFGTSTTGHAASGFGATSDGGTTIKFNPVTGTDTCVINGVIHSMNTSYQSITVMKEYETKAFEELRFEYYFANRKVGQQGAVYGGIFESPKTLFSSTTTLNTGLFGVNDNNLLYGTTSTTPILLGDFYVDVITKVQLFAAPQTNIFGTTASSTFVTQTSGFGQDGFGQPNQNNLFGKNKSAFGLGSTQSTGFGFGTNIFTSSRGLFGSKPNSGFQMTSSAFGTDNTFGATSTAQPATGGLFGSKAFTEAPAISLFNQTTNNITGVFNATSSGGKWKENTRNEGTGLFGLSHRSSVGTGGSFFGSNKQTGKLGLFGK
ncbi:nuclear pore complex protein DDB_G0274915-like isoform X2 [Acyrthosiphon pisum]|uniref:Nuclear pore complex protein Nup98-Nup96 n=1 Tax=Acyrthosiphon pisum TaxID=7029 RepID=A0A8R2D467_ACYPI|nr:nuclear pore complex protein DDB_G0274915-like isoform X2 [Acyrthosiphon pisum]|eukprot:XP_016660453.1 PREDICTED: nuclear pore complex protein DDB_G0274915-like isoform X2 [Acyrthosiphon pisum]